MTPRVGRELHLKSLIANMSSLSTGMRAKAPVGTPFRSGCCRVGAFNTIRQQRRPILRAADEQSSSGGQSTGQLNDAMLAELRAAQEEAARLRKELEATRAASAFSSKDVVEAKPKRIDSTDNRETLWGSGKRSAWLSEADVEFFTGGGSSETASTSAPTVEQQSTVQRRVLLGGLATAGLVAFALVPTKELRLKPSKPLYFFLVQLIRVQEQLKQCKDIIEDGQWSDLRFILARINGPPGNIRQTLYDAVSLVDGATASKAEPLAADILEYLDAMDYNKYFDAMPTRQISGAENAEFVKFSGQALKAAQQRLAAFLAVMPADELAAAQQAIDAESVTADE